VDKSVTANYQTLQLNADFSVFITENPAHFKLSDQDSHLIEHLWSEEIKRCGPHLFNGQLLCHVRHDASKLIGQFVQYKHYLAVLREPELRKKIPINALGISGMTFSGPHVLIGKRAAFVTDFPGWYECAPSGGLDPAMAVKGVIDPKTPFVRELLEETGIAEKDVLSTRVLRLIYDNDTHLYEIHAVITVDETLATKKLPASEEYQELLWVTKEKIGEFLNKHVGKIVPLSEYLLTNLSHAS
jgi:hypothetical protein